MANNAPAEVPEEPALEDLSEETPAEGQEEGN